MRHSCREKPLLKGGWSRERLGINIFDNLDFERAVEQARRLNRFEFLFTAAPLRIEKSPLNPLAIF
jgi:hypothetical protein